MQHWATLMKLDDSEICRHCRIAIETVDHLFGECDALDYTQFGFENWKNLSECARNYSDPLYRSKMKNFAKFVSEKRIFRLY